MRLRSQENVLAELRELVAEFPAVEYVYFEIETISADQEWAFRFAELLEEFNSRRKKPLDFALNLRVHANTRFRRLFEALKRAGFIYVRIGIESGSPRVRNEILKRNETNDDIIRAFDDAREVGLHTYAYNLVGLPRRDPGRLPGDRRAQPPLQADAELYRHLPTPTPGRTSSRCAPSAASLSRRSRTAPSATARASGSRSSPTARSSAPSASSQHSFPARRSPLAARVDEYVWQTLRGYPRARALRAPLHGPWVLTKVRSAAHSVTAMFPRDS